MVYLLFNTTDLHEFFFCADRDFHLGRLILEACICCAQLQLRVIQEETETM